MDFGGCKLMRHRLKILFCLYKRGQFKDSKKNVIWTKSTYHPYNCKDYCWWWWWCCYRYCNQQLKFFLNKEVVESDPTLQIFVPSVYGIYTRIRREVRGECVLCLALVLSQYRDISSRQIKLVSSKFVSFQCKMAHR